MTLTLTLTDNYDGTVTAAGSGTSGATCKVYRGTYAVSGPEYPMTLQGSFVGDSSVTVSGEGYWNWRLDAGIGLSTEEVYFPVHEGGDSVYDRCLTMVADRISSLSLDGVGDRVYVREVPVTDTGLIELPCIVVTDYGQQEDTIGGGSTFDDYAYPVSVVMLDTVSPGSDDPEQRRRGLRWREAIHRACDHQSWDRRVPEVYECEVQPAQVIDPTWEQQYSYRMSGLVVKCQARQLRGTTVGKQAVVTE